MSSAPQCSSQARQCARPCRRLPRHKVRPSASKCTPALKTAICGFCAATRWDHACRQRCSHRVVECRGRYAFNLCSVECYIQHECVQLVVTLALEGNRGSGSGVIFAWCEYEERLEEKCSKLFWDGLTSLDDGVRHVLESLLLLRSRRFADTASASSRDGVCESTP